ncbi:MAG TPA: VCBS repeat-containing protein [Longimicrobiales bacterium]
MKKAAPSRRLVLHTTLALALGCTGLDDPAARGFAELPEPGDQLFTALPAAATGVEFVNRLEETQELNVFTYRNYYNGGGVALGDLTGDGLPELLLTSNLDSNRLYLNQGGFRFRDITRAAGVGGRGFWATGATMVDVNGDGLLDLYVCFAGNVAGERRANELYINDGPGPDGVPTFTEAAAAWGIADEGYSTHAAFFDYDRDGDLDLYLVNNSFRPVSSFGLRNIRHIRDANGGDRLYRNDGSRFVDVSEEAGIYGSEIGFGLGVAVGDVDRDGWPDIYVSNDFFERDYLYINRGDGTFDESLDRRMPYISYFSMGLDIADLDNDGWSEIYVTDMLPEDDERLKLTTAFEGWDTYQTKLKNDYHHQFMRNMLHRNNGDGTFSDIGQLGGIARTDWSWSALLADFDLDGHKDIHVTNGMPRDLTSQDYIAFLANDATMAEAIRENRVDFLRLIEAMSSTPLPNYAFRNNGDLTFSNRSAEWGLNTSGFSNGAAYGDLDGDGAADLVVNNINQPASIYRNNARTLGDNRYLQVVLEGEGRNRFGVGARVTLHADGGLFFQELMPSRGFQSSVDYVLTFGLGAAAQVDSLVVEWPDGRIGVQQNVPVDQRVVVRQRQSVARAAPEPAPEPLLADVTSRVRLDFAHRENAFVDFDRERLMPKLMSTEGPFLAVADVNGDGLSDGYIGGAKDQAGQLLIQTRGGGFASGSAATFRQDSVSEDLGAVFFDADGDGDVDLYVVSGGNEFSDLAPALQDRLYLNDGSGRFRKAEGHLPAQHISGSRVITLDFDRDGDIDLFVGGRVVPWRYGLDPASALLRNDGRGRFSDVTEQVAPGLERVGMVTDAAWTDVDGDRRPDLVLVGEWMPVTVFRGTAAGRLERIEVPGLERSHGWWNRIVAGDFTGDGRTDFIIGNLGLNTRLHASADEPLAMYVKDFARTGFVQQIISHYQGGASYPLVLRDDLIKTITFLKARYINFEDYARQTVADVFPEDVLAEAVQKKAHTFATALARNNGDGSYTLVPLPHAAQVAPVYGILPGDFDGDRNIDLLLAGNFDGVKPELGRMSASWGVLLRGDGTGGFTAVPSTASGFFVPGQARDIQRMRTAAGELIVVTRNNDRPLIFAPRGTAAARAIAASPETGFLRPGVDR